MCQRGFRQCPGATERPLVSRRCVKGTGGGDKAPGTPMGLRTGDHRMSRHVCYSVRRCVIAGIRMPGNQSAWGDSTLLLEFELGAQHAVGVDAQIARYNGLVAARPTWEPRFGPRFPRCWSWRGATPICCRWPPAGAGSSLSGPNRGARRRRCWSRTYRACKRWNSNRPGAGALLAAWDGPGSAGRRRSPAGAAALVDVGEALAVPDLADDPAGLPGWSSEIEGGRRIRS